MQRVFCVKKIGTTPTELMFQCPCNTQFANLTDLEDHISSCPDFINNQIQASVIDHQYVDTVSSVSIPMEPTDDERGPFIWKDASTRLLLRLYEENIDNFNSPRLRKKAVWEMIAQQFAEHGYEITCVQCENKWKSMSNNCKKIQSNSNTSKKAFKYYKEVIAILNKEPASDAVVVNSTPTAFVDDTDITEIVYSPNESPALSPSIAIHASSSNKNSQIKNLRLRKKRLLHGRNQLLEFLKKKEENREKRHDRKMELLQKNNELLEKLIIALSKE